MKTAEEWAVTMREQVHVGALVIRAVQIAAAIQSDARKDLEQERDEANANFAAQSKASDMIRQVLERVQQERDTLQRSNAELAKSYNLVQNALVTLAASEARLREALLMWKSFPHPALQQCGHPDCMRHNAATIDATEQALSLTPSDALKPLLEFVKQVAHHNFVIGNKQVDEARAILKQYGHE